MDYQVDLTNLKNKDPIDTWKNIYSKMLGEILKKWSVHF